MAARAADYDYNESNYEDDYAYEEEIQTTYITRYALNLRTEPSTDGERIRTVPAGRRVEVTCFRDGVWFAVEIGGQAGYMYAEFLRPLPVGAASGAEMLDWSTARNILPRNTPITIMDVRTGLTFDISVFSAGNHADVVPVTAQDTATMLQAFGGRWCWEPRPVLVFLSDRTIAASINGMPHGTSGGNTVNNMNGHVCLHFLNSRTHNGNRAHERNHQNAVREAYNHANR